MSLNTELINCTHQGKTAIGKSAQDLDRVKRMYGVTSEVIAAQSKKLFEAARATADAAKERGLAAIERVCAALDQQEQAESARRAADADYLSRLEMKIRLAQGMGDDLSDEDREMLKNLFQEFAGDALSVTVIKKSLGENKAFFFLPEDNTGKRQQHLKGAVTKLFERAMNEAGCDPAAFTADPAARDAEISAFCEYCTRQNEDFSRDDGEIWQEIRDQRAQDGAPAAVKFDMAMTMGRL